ncbi:MAG: hypothetical protein KKA42_03230, partial [candidate division Zixibacteria bacterium]|nr:hypothetical protein [candidate division Zixibacteria bacterium]
MVSRITSAGRVLQYLALVVVLLVMVLPLVWMFRVAFLPAGSAVTIGAAVSSGWTVSNFTDLFAGGLIGLPLLNSAVVGLLVTGGN